MNLDKFLKNAMELVDWLIIVNSMSTCLGLFHV